MGSDFAGVLEGLVKTEDDRVEPVLFLYDMDAVRMAASWRRLRKERKPAEGPPPEDEARRWNWLWAQVTFSVEDWSALANVALPAARRLARVLVENRVVYPDSSLHLLSAKHVQRRALKLARLEK